MDKSSLGDRMKTYEAVPKLYLMRRTPVIIRLDMCHGHTFTRGFERPYDELFSRAMAETTKALCEQIQGCVLGYTQSDEISLVLCDYKKLTSAAWFDNQLQKITSVSAAMATRAFNQNFNDFLEGATQICAAKGEVLKNIVAYRKAYENGAIFDSRAFNLPKEEVCNYFIWRQQDATRNSIQGLAQSIYPHNEIQGLSCSVLQNKMFEEKGVNWDELPVKQKRGLCVKRFEDGNWDFDYEIPIFTQNRFYIESKIYFED